MSDLGTRMTDERVRALDKRMDGIYSTAYDTAIRRERQALNRMALFNVSLPVDITDEQRRTQALLQANSKAAREMSDRIASYLSEGGAKAVTEIRRTTQEAYSINLDYGRFSIDRQAGVFLPYETIDARQLRIQLGLEGDPPFSKIRSIEEYKGWTPVRDKDGVWMVKDGKKVRRSIYARDRAFAGLADDRMIVRRLQNELTQSMLLGESRTQLTARFRKVAGMSHRQAMMVAQTEITRIQSQTRHLSILEAQALGVEMEKTWMARMVRTRDTHADLNGITVPAGDPWITIDGNELMFPGDPDAHAEEVINCHCVERPRVKDVPLSVIHAREMAGMTVDKRIGFAEWRERRGN